MLLAIDTVTRWTGLALFDGTTLLAEWGWRCQNTQTIELAPAVLDLLSRTGYTMADLTVLAVAAGPGSYTGMRVGLGFAKGLALARSLPLIGIATLDILAAAQPATALPLVAVAEAGRTRLLTGRYRYADGTGWQATGRPIVQSAAELAAEISEPTLLAGEISATARGAIEPEAPQATFAPATANVRRAGVLAELGWRRWQAGKIDDPATLVPDYLRPPAGA
jgi:tRNA threonylcarbamoyladenosine biosynthesis protein TsaB